MGDDRVLSELPFHEVAELRFRTPEKLSLRHVTSPLEVPTPDKEGSLAPRATFTREPRYIAAPRGVARLARTPGEVCERWPPLT